MGGRLGMMLAALLAVGCEAGGDREANDRAAGATPSAARAGTATDHEAEAVRCMEAADWECATRELREAGAPEATRARLVTALAAEAKRREKVLELARPGRDRLVAAQDAAAAWALWADVSGKPLPASARRVSSTAAKEEKAAARREAGEQHRFAPARECCRHCTSGCPCGDSCISCSQTCRKGPGCAC